MMKKLVLLYFLMLLCTSKVLAAGPWYSNTTGTATINGSNSSGWSTSSSGPFATQKISTGDVIILQGCAVTVSVASTVSNVTMTSGSSITTNGVLTVTGTLTSNGSTVTFGTSTNNIILAAGAIVNNFVQSGAGAFTINGSCSLTGTNTFSGAFLFANTNLGYKVTLGNSNTFGTTINNGTGNFFIGSSSSALSLGGAATLYFDQTTPGTTNVLSSLVLTGSANPSINNLLTITSTFTLGTSNGITLSNSGYLKFTGASFTTGGGIITATASSSNVFEIGGSSAVTIPAAITTSTSLFANNSNVTISNSGGVTWAGILGGHTTTLNNLTINGGYLIMNNNNANAAEVITVGGTLSGSGQYSLFSGAAAGSKISMANGSTISGFVQSAIAPNVMNFASNATVNFVGTNSLTAGPYCFSGVIINLASSNTSFAAGLNGLTPTIQGSNTATLSVGGGTLSFSQTGANNQLASLSISAATTLSNPLTVTSLNLLAGQLTNTGSLTLSNGGTIAITSGTISSATNLFTSNVNVTYNGAVTTGNELPNNIGTGNLTINANVLLNAGLTLNNLLIASNVLLNTTTQTITINGTAILNSGSILNTSTGQITISGATTVNSNATIGASSSQLTFNGLLTLNTNALLSMGASTVTANSGLAGTGSVSTNGGVLIIGGGNTPLNLASSPNNSLQSLMINLNNSTNIVTLGSSLILMGGLNIQNGILDITGQNLNITGIVSSVANTGTLSGSPTSGLTLTNVTGTLNMTPNTRMLNNVTVNSGTAIQLNDSLNIYGLLAVKSNAALNTQGYLTLISNSSATAAIDSLSGILLGNVTVQRYISSKTARKYSFVGSPVAGSTIRNAWQQQMYITGSGSGGVPCGSTNGDGGATDKYNSNGFDRTVMNASGMFFYANTLVSGTHWTSVTNPDTTLLYPGKGYKINIRGDRNSVSVSCQNQLNSTFSTPPAPVTLSASGTVQTGRTVVNLNSPNSNPYTLIANPFPCPISFTAFQDSNASLINAKIWTYSPFGNGSYTTFIPAIGAIPAAITNPAIGYDNTTGDYIASGQAFFVEAANLNTASDSVIFNEVHKVSGAGIPNTKLFGTSTFPMVRVGLSTTSGSYLDEVLIRFDSMGSKKYDAKFDAVSFGGGSASITTLKQGKGLAIATSPANYAADTVQIGINSASTGSFHLSFSDFVGMTKAPIILLRDKFLSINQDIRLNPVYDFNITTDTLCQGNNRFEIVFNNSGILPLNFINISATKSDGGAIVKWQVENETNTATYMVERSIDGIDFAEITTTFAKGMGVYFIKDGTLPANATTIYYRIKAFEKDGSFSQSRLAKLTTNNSPLTTILISPNPVKDVLNITLGDEIEEIYSIRVLSLEGTQLIKKEGISGNRNTISLNAGSLSNGIYIAKLTDANGNTLIQRFVKQ